MGSCLPFTSQCLVGSSILPEFADGPFPRALSTHHQGYQVGSTGWACDHVSGTTAAKSCGTGSRAAALPSQPWGTGNKLASNEVSNLLFLLSRAPHGFSSVTQALPYLPACVKMAQLPALDEANRSHLSLWRLLSTQGSKDQALDKSTKAGLYRSSQPSASSAAHCADTGGQNSPAFLLPNALVSLCACPGDKSVLPREVTTKGFLTTHQNASTDENPKPFIILTNKTSFLSRSEPYTKETRGWSHADGRQLSSVKLPRAASPARAPLWAPWGQEAPRSPGTLLCS
ncbi:hypothetical protein Anapl_06948 [Anas platyrhynchos]|uniref:Uncharacterized protein n=1 Tax=Anas platyrhynchos TaxID=8839 RepID=R0LLV1_ANAPL|nr:hypothetical protein Anapl_06948 [Anas platyrhynchos]